MSMTMADTTIRNHRDRYFPFTLEEETWPEDAEKETIKIGDGRKTLGFEYILLI